MPTTASDSRTRSNKMMPSLPAGFRFHPTDEELIVHYLMNQAAAVPCPVPIIAEVNIYQCNPWDLPPKALFGEKEWYFFSPRDRKYPNGARPNRAAGSGYWKATGTDKAIVSAATSESVGVKKALVFYRGKPPRGVKTDWIMQEYRLTAGGSNNKNKNAKSRGGSSSYSSMRLDDWVLCRIYKKSNNFQFASSDQEQEQEQEEGSTVEEEEDTASLHINNNSSSSAMNISGGAVGAPSPNSDDTGHQHQLPPPLSMTKSCSLTDLLSTLDYATLSQLLLDGPAAEPTEPHSPLIYAAHACQHPLNNVNNYSTSINTPQQGDALLMGSDYGYNSDLKRKRVMTTTDNNGANTTTSFDDGSSSLKKKLMHLPSDSRSSASEGSFLGTSSSTYCNQQQLAEAATSASSIFQYQYHPFLNQQLLLNNHLEMQWQCVSEEQSRV